MPGLINQYIIRVLIFLILVILVTVIVYPQIQTAFLSNIYINSIIVFSLFFGIFFNIFQIIQIKNNSLVLASFNIHKSPQNFITQKGLLKNLVQDLKEIDGRYTFKSSSVNKILESIDLSSISVRETSRYLVGLLVFLGLLGTFWGLLKTIGSVGNVIGGLGIDDTNVAGFFNSLKDGLTAPLDGMSIAFSSSLLGLAGSLILGFIDLQLGQAQNKFSQYAEKIIINNSTPDFKDAGSNFDNPTVNAIQKIYDNLDSLVYSLKENSNNQKQIFNLMDLLTKQIKELTSNSKEQDLKLSNFLSTQLNTQGVLSQVLSEFSKKGIYDTDTKKAIKNIEKNIQNLKTSTKKK